jgi:hypothetical protein
MKRSIQPEPQKIDQKCTGPKKIQLDKYRLNSQQQLEEFLLL